MDDDIRIVEEDQEILEEAPPPNLRIRNRLMKKPDIRHIIDDENLDSNRDIKPREKEIIKKKLSLSLIYLFIVIVILQTAVIVLLLNANSALQNERASANSTTDPGQFSYNNQTKNNGSFMVHFYNNYPFAAQYWDFGDGFFSTDPDPYHSYEKPGTYMVRFNGTMFNSQNITIQEMEEIPINSSFEVVETTTNGVDRIDKNLYPWTNPEKVPIRIKNVTYSEYKKNKCAITEQSIFLVHLNSNNTGMRI
jgi:hypothetical protein